MPRNPRESEAPPKLEAETNYSVFDTLNIIPIRMTCEAYKPYHKGPSNYGCHTRLKISHESVESHLAAGHSGGFILDFKRIPQKNSIFWKSLKAAKLEVVEVRCAHCNVVMDMTPTKIGWHLKPHPGNIKASHKATTTFLITFTKDLPKEEDYLLDLENQEEDLALA